MLQLGNEIAFNEAVIEEREQGIREIEDQIGQANDIFRDLAVLVHEQGVVIGMPPKLYISDCLKFSCYHFSLLFVVH